MTTGRINQVTILTQARAQGALKRADSNVTLVRT
jgi:hypothetical protein